MKVKVKLFYIEEKRQIKYNLPMLKLLRHKNVAKLVLWAILILILPAFVIWGTGAGGRSRDGRPAFVGLIDNKKVTFNDFAESLISIRCQIVLNYFNQPKVMDKFLSSKEFLGKLAWDRLLMAKEAEKARMKVSNNEVVNFIRNHSIFMRGDVFDERMYAYILRNNLGLEPRTFEEIVRSNLAIQKLNNKMTKDIGASEAEILQAYERDNDKFKISYVMFFDDDFLDKTNINDDQIKEYYEEHAKELIAPVKEGDGERPPGTAAEFNDVKAEIKTILSRRQAREIAISYVEEERTKLKSLIERKNLSFSPACSELGLTTKELAFFSRNDYIESLGEALQIVDTAILLKPNEISNPIQTANGVIIFVVVDRQKFDQEKFKAQRDDYAKKTAELKKTQYLEDWVRGLEQTNKINIEFKDYEKYYR